MRERATVGRYSITGTLGEGGMGIVYAARDEQLGRAVAIKMLRATSEPAARDRLFREARSAASLNHPAICQLYEIGEDGGELFLAMELLQGESLAARLARGALPLGEAVSVTLGVLHGIEALHRQGLVHRDLKPSNIFLTPHGVKLLDFGLATAANGGGDGGATATRLTVPGTVVGTPQYAAPEQLQGGDVDTRTDLFAVGAVLYEMLAGKPPFAGASPVEVFHAILYEQPPVLTGGPAVVALDRVVHRALSKNKSERYQSIDAMARDLRAAMALGDSGTAASARALTRLIVLPFRILRQDPETDFLAFSLADALTSSLSGLQSLVVRSSAAAGRFAGDAPDLKAIAAETEVDLVLLGTILRAGPQLRVTTQLVETTGATVIWSHTAQVAVGDLFSVQDDLVTRIVESLSLPLTARERRMLKQDVPSSSAAYELYLRANEMSRESKDWEAALALYERCLTEDPHYAPAWAGAGRMHRMIGKYFDRETEGRLARAEQALKRALELNPDLSVAENVLAHLEVDLGRAEASMVRLLTRAKDRPADPDLYAGLTHACRYCGLLTASIAAAEQARRLDPRIRTSGAHSYFMLGDYERVLEFQPEAIPYMRNLGLVMLGRSEEALAELDHIAISNQNRLSYYVRALRHTVRGERREAADELQRLIDIPDPEGRFYIARGFAYIGYADEALSLINQVVEGGFFCLPAFTRDPWLDSLRAHPTFAATLRRAEARHRQALISFLNAEGDRILGVAHPA